MFFPTPLLLELLGMGAGDPVETPARPTQSYGGGAFLAITYPHQRSQDRSPKKEITGKGSIAFSIKRNGQAQIERPVRDEQIKVPRRESLNLHREGPPVIARRTPPAEPKVAAIDPVIAKAPVKNRRLAEEEEMLAAILAAIG